MKRPKVSEKLLINDVAKVAIQLAQLQQGLNIGYLISLIRTQIGMSQRTLAKRANVSQSTLSRIELSDTPPNLATLQRILNALGCECLISFVPREGFESMRKKQAEKMARKRVAYLRGTMSLEEQEPDEQLIEELIQQETEKLLRASGQTLWDEEL